MRLVFEAAEVVVVGADVVEAGAGPLGADGVAIGVCDVDGAGMEVPTIVRS